MWFINHISEIKILKNFGTYMEKALNGGLLEVKKLYRECQFANFGQKIFGTMNHILHQYL